MSEKRKDVQLLTPGLIEIPFNPFVANFQKRTKEILFVPRE